MQLPKINKPSAIVSAGVLITLFVILVLIAVTMRVHHYRGFDRCMKDTRCTTTDHRMMGHGAMPSNTMNGMSMTSLEGKTGDEFDKAFLSEMIVHHEAAVEMAYMVKKTSTRPELLTLADQIITAQNEEISLMRKWLAEWFK